MGEMVYGIPVITLKGLTILPGMAVHFDVLRKRSRVKYFNLTLSDITLSPSYIHLVV